MNVKIIITNRITPEEELWHYQLFDDTGHLASEGASYKEAEYALMGALSEKEEWESRDEGGKGMNTQRVNEYYEDIWENDSVIHFMIGMLSCYGPNINKTPEQIWEYVYDEFIKSHPTHKWNFSGDSFVCSCGQTMGPDIKDLDIAKLRADNARLRAALEAVEWVPLSPSRSVCPWCHHTTGFYGGEHAETCPRQLALNGEPQNEP